MKKFFINLLLCLATVLCLMGFASCDIGTSGGGGGNNGTYYLYRNGDYVKSSFFKLEGDTWTDDDGETGTFTISNGEITFYYTEFGETFDLCDGTISNGVLFVMGDYYCKEGKTPSNGGDSGDSGSSENTAVQFTVTYNANGGAFENGETTITETVDSNAVLTAPEAPQKANYTFDGWATSAFGTEKWNFATDQVTKDVTLYAVWTQQSAAILSVDGASIKGQEIFMLVNKNTDSVSLSNKVVCSDNSVWKLYYDKLGQMEIPTKIAASTNGSLLNGDNVFYVVVTSKDGTQTNLYELNVHRSYAVSVNYYDGETLLKTDTAYTGYEYTADYTPNITGYTFNDWNYTKRVLWDNLNLYVDKTANTYTVAYDVNGGDELTTTEKTVTYDSNYTLVKPTRTGYTFLGWYQGSTQLTDEKGKSLAAWKGTNSLTAKAKWIITDMLQFEYAERQDEYCITGIKNKTVMNIVVPDCVAEISAGAFKDCSNLTSITLPFVGESKTARGYKAVFGYIFGYVTSSNSNYIDGTRLQYTDNSFAYHYYIPASLKEVTITGGNIPLNAFKNCSSLTSIDIPDGVTSIGESAFYACLSLKIIAVSENNTAYASQDGILYNKEKTEFVHIPRSVTGAITIPDGVTSIGEGAFEGRDSLTSIEIPDSVTFIGNSAFFSCDSLTGVTIPNSVTFIGSRAFCICSSLTSIEIPDSVTFIGNSAFRGCSSLTSIEIPDSVTSIGAYVFYDCSSLTSVTIPGSVTSIGEFAFAYCSSLTSIEIPDSVTSIGDYAFNSCSSLTSIEIPDSVTSIGESAFRACSSLTEITLPFVGTSKNETSATSSTLFGYIFGKSSYTGGKATEQYYNSSSYTTYYIPTSLKRVKITGGNILSRAFYNCSGLTSIEILDTVTSIGVDAFYGCSSLTYNLKANLKYLGNKQNPYLYLDGVDNTSITSATIENTCKWIGIDAFSGCDSLTSVKIGDSVTSIGNSAFKNCSSLMSVVIGESVTSIGFSAFRNCSSLTSVTIPDSVTSIDNSAFENCSSLMSVVIGESVTSIGSSAFEYCKGLTSVTIPDSVTSIGSSAFGNCSSLTSVEIGDSVTTIDNWAFENCDSLTNVTIGGCVTSIGGSAFGGCSSLTSIVIPDSVTFIGGRAFENCSSLTSITIPDSVTYIGRRAFQGCNALTIYCEAANRPSGWDNEWNFNVISEWLQKYLPVVWGYKA